MSTSEHVEVGRSNGRQYLWQLQTQGATMLNFFAHLVGFLFQKFALNHNQTRLDG